MDWFLHISQPITAMGKRDFKCQTPIHNNVQVSSSCIVINLKVWKRTLISVGGGCVGWGGTQQTPRCCVRQPSINPVCNTLLHSIRTLLLWGKFWWAFLFLRELLQIEEIESKWTLVNKVSNSFTGIKKFYSGSVMWWHNYC